MGGNGNDIERKEKEREKEKDIKKLHTHRGQEQHTSETPSLLLSDLI